MKPAPISEVENICRGFVSNFLSENSSRLPYGLLYAMDWKEDVNRLEEVTLKFLGTLKQVWQNPAFRPEFLATILIFERQSLASADRRGYWKVGRRPDIMFLSKEDDKFYELMYTECSKVICTKQKEEEDDGIQQQIITPISKKLFIPKLESMKSLLWKLPINKKTNISESDDIYLKIYATGTLSNDEIVYTTSRFHGKINMLAEISFSFNQSVLPVVLVCWCDYCSKRHSLKYGCPHMKLVKHYDVIPFNSMQD
nr:6709_t:CDS:2 [Entrophospora candida]